MKSPTQLIPGNELSSMMIKVMGFGSRAFQIGGGSLHRSLCDTGQANPPSEPLFQLRLPQECCSEDYMGYIS